MPFATRRAGLSRRKSPKANRFVYASATTGRALIQASLNMEGVRGIGACWVSANEPSKSERNWRLLIRPRSDETFGV